MAHLKAVKGITSIDMAGHQDGAYGLHVLVSGFRAPLCKLLPPRDYVDPSKGPDGQGLSRDTGGHQSPDKQPLPVWTLQPVCLDPASMPFKAFE